MAQCRVKFYSRDDGPTCYESYLSSNRADSVDIVGQLRVAEHNFFWASRPTRYSPIVQTGDSSRRARGLTRLNTETASDLVADLTEETHDGFGRELAILIIQASSPAIETFDDLKQLLADFINDQKSLVEMVFFQFDDSPKYLFVKSQVPSPEIQHLLTNWGLFPVEKKCCFPYRKLGRVKIESTWNNVLALSFPDDPRSKLLKCVP